MLCSSDFGRAFFNNLFHRDESSDSELRKGDPVDEEWKVCDCRLLTLWGLSCSTGCALGVMVAAWGLLGAEADLLQGKL